MPLKPGQPAVEARVYTCSGCGYLTAMLKGEIAAECPHCAPKKKSYAWLSTRYELMLRTKNVAEEVQRRSTWADRFSDKITSFCGNMHFVYAHVVWFALWIVYNLSSSRPFDPFPFGLLTMLVSLEAIMLATFILISQNRQSAISDLRSELDYQVNLKSEKMISEMRAMQQQIYNAVTGKKE